MTRNVRQQPIDTKEILSKIEEIAQQKANCNLKRIEEFSSEEVRQAFHNLEVHQIELEMQNIELRRAHVELDELRARYFELYDLAPLGYCTISEKGLILEANLAMETLLGIPRSSLVKQPFTQFINEESQDIYYLYRNKIFGTGKVSKIELKMVKNDGTIFWVELSSTFKKINNDTNVCFILLNNISEHKLAEKVLKESEERYHRLVELSPNLIAIHLNAKILYINKAGANMFGFSNPEQLIGKSFLDYLPLREKKIAKDRIKKILHTNRRSPVYEQTIRRPDGTEIFVEVVGVPFNFKEETAIQIIAKDVTKQKKAESIILKANEQLRKKTIALEDTNTALRVLLSKKEEDAQEVGENIFCNYESMISPFLNNLKNSYSNKNQMIILDLIEKNLKEIISPFSKKLSDPMISLSPKEIQIASFIKQGITSKEMAKSLNCSVRTIEGHRDNIRMKLKIKNKKLNLRSFLNNL